MELDIQLTRKDLYQSTCITGRSLALMPPSDKKKCHRVVVGADNGIVTCFKVKKGEPEVEFQTGNLDYPVLRLIIGGSKEKSDKIFFTSGQTVRGVNKKGKEFFKFSTDGAESLRGLHVEETKLWTSGDYLFNFYVDNVESGYYMSPDKINDVLLLPIQSPSEYNPVLGCQDRQVRILDKTLVLFESFVDGPVSSLSKLQGASYEDVLKQNKMKKIVYGTENGLIGELQVDSTVVRPGWTIQNVRSLGSINAIACHDLTKNGMEDVIVGRDDGEMQVFTVDSQGEMHQIFTKSINESIQDIEVGRVCTTNFDEVVLASYSGKIVSFTSEPLSDPVAAQALSGAPRLIEKSLVEGEVSPDKDGEHHGKELKKKKSGLKLVAASIGALTGLGKKKDKDKDKDKKAEKPKYISGLVLDEATPDSAGSHGDEAARTDPTERNKKIEALQKEIKALQEKVQDEKLKYQKLSTESVPVSTRSKVKSNLYLDTNLACQKFTLESEMPIDMVALQSSIPLVLLDTGVSFPSVSPPDPDEGNAFVATLRVHGTSNRLQVQLMCDEGQVGTLVAYVVTRVSPKVVHRVEHILLPLSLHQSTPLDDGFWQSSPYCEVKIQGTFSQGQMHTWLTHCFPSIPAKVPDSNIVKFAFDSTFASTRVTAEYSKGEAVFRSTNFTTLATIKDVISKEANSAKVKLDVKAPVFDDSCVMQLLKLLHPKVNKLLKLKENYLCLEALEQLASSEEDRANLSPSMREILENSAELKAEHKNNEKRIAFMERVLEQLFLDRFKFKGVNVKHRLSSVQSLIQNYSWESFVELFAAAR
uniref:Bardet-Biedl syndrome 7 protein homolog n=1 Tax=Hanusia phi TaxID=3032 RepID=A0A7S0HYF4_9CRYP|mmetsp:Transcript_6273/g.14434  ORF Transcript_6273/g.14434 Transcript_6273/m.14434 type:complete len:814 (+) Transcript_6273:115-2556(+)